MLKIEVVYVPAGKKAVHIKFDVEEVVTVEQAIKLSKIGDEYPEIYNLKAGIFSKAVPLNSFIKDGDRIEIYRPLLIDPKERRRKKAKS